MLILQRALWLWGTADILGKMVTLGPDRELMLCWLFFPKIPPGALLSLWFHSLSALQHLWAVISSPSASSWCDSTNQLLLAVLGWVSEPWALSHPLAPQWVLPHLLLFVPHSLALGGAGGLGAGQEQGIPALVTPPFWPQSPCSPVCGFPDLPWECTVDSCSSVLLVLPGWAITSRAELVTSWWPRPGAVAEVWPRSEVCWGSPGLKLCHSHGSCFLISGVAYKENEAELSLREHMEILNCPGHCLALGCSVCHLGCSDCHLGYSDCHLKLIKPHCDCTHCPSLGTVHCHSL